jgi:hypothetical protein
MNATRVVAVVFLAVAVASSTGAARAQQLPISPLDWLVGGTWVAQGTNMPPDTSRIETQYRTATTGNFIQFTTQFLGKDGKPAGNYAGNFFFDPATKNLAMWYMDRDNTIVHGPVVATPSGMTMTFIEDGASMGVNGPIDFQVTVTKSSANAYRWALAARKGGSSDAYKALFALDYVRE